MSNVRLHAPEEPEDVAEGDAIVEVDAGDVAVDTDELPDEVALGEWLTVAEGAALTARLNGKVMFPGVPSVGAAGSTMENSGLWFAAFPVTGTKACYLLY